MSIIIEKRGLCYSFNMQQFFSVYLVLAVESTCPRSVGEHEETEEATTIENPGSQRLSQHRGNRKAKAMKKREAKGQASEEEAKASVEEAEELVENGNEK